MVVVGILVRMCGDLFGASGFVEVVVVDRSGESELYLIVGDELGDAQHGRV